MGVCICEWVSWIFLYPVIILGVSSSQYYSLLSCVVWQCLNYAGILQSISGSFSSGCESNRGLAWGFVFLAGPCYSCVVGMVGDPGIRLNCPVSLN